MEMKETYWAIEPSLQWSIQDYFLGISATSGVFLFFDPKAYMAKAGISFLLKQNYPMKKEMKLKDWIWQQVWLFSKLLSMIRRKVHLHKNLA